MTVSAYVINRDQDTARLDRFMKNWEKSYLPLTRVPAIDAHDPHFVISSNPYFRGEWFGKPEVKQGAFGCFLSHIKAWEIISSSNDDFGIVFEDDALPNEGFEQDLNRWFYEKDEELLFFNNRIATWTTGMEPAHSANISAAVENVVSNGYVFGEEIRHPGADGYVLTPEGAGRLLRLAGDFGIRMGVDWFKVAAATTEYPNGYSSYFLFNYAKNVPTVLSGSILQKPVSFERSGAFEGSVLDHSIFVEKQRLT